MFKTTLEELKEIDYLISFCIESQDDYFKLYESGSISNDEFKDKFEKFSKLKTQLYAKKNPKINALFSKWDIKIWLDESTDI